MLDEFIRSTVMNLAQHYFDEYVENLCRTSTDYGVSATLTRRQLGKCCKWCASLCGTFDYESGNYPDDVFKRHENCRCIVTFKRGKGAVTDVHSKKDYASEREAVQGRIKELEDNGTVMDETVKEYFKKSNPGRGKLTIKDGLEPTKDQLHDAMFLHDNFGGDIEITESGVNWNGENWFMDSVTKETDLAKLIKGKKNIVLDFGDEEPDLEELEKLLSGNGGDIMVVSKNSVLKIFR